MLELVELQYLPQYLGLNSKPSSIICVIISTEYQLEEILNNSFNKLYPCSQDYLSSCAILPYPSCSAEIPGCNRAAVSAARQSQQAACTY